MKTSHAFRCGATIAAGLAGCAAVQPPTDLPEVRPGYVAGYLEASQWPDSCSGARAWIRLAEADPGHAGAIYKRGLDYGMSRVYCGVHYPSDVEAGRVIGAATVSRLHADPVFREQLTLAAKEIAAQRAANAKPGADCDLEARATNSGK